MTPKTHSPLMLDATGLHSDYLRECVALRDCVKVAIFHPVVPDYIWLEVVMMSATYWIGQVRSRTTMVDWIHKGDLVRFHACNIYEVCKSSETAEA